MMVRLAVGGLGAAMLMLPGCQGVIGEAGERAADERGERDAGTVCPAPEGLERTQEIMLGLAPHCAGCHGANAGEMGYFASLEAFVDLLVGDPRLVTAGDAEGSRLVRLLEGRAEGIGQMPLAGAAYAERGDAQLTMAEVRRYIDELGVLPTDERPDGDASTAPRIPTELFVEALPDFLHVEVRHVRAPENFLTDDPDHPRTGATTDLYQAFGGPSAVESTVANERPHVTFTQYLVPLGQRWCGLSLAGDAGPLWTTAGRTTGPDEPEVVRQNIEDMMLFLLGAEASDDEVDFLFDEVFVRLAAEEDLVAAWTGVCAAILRDPRFVFY